MEADYDWKSIAKANIVWTYFEEHKTNGDYRCKTCKKIFKGKYIGSARYHLQCVHGIQHEQEETEQEKSDSKAKNKSSSQPLISTMMFKSKEDLGLVLSRLTALDRLSFNCIANSKDILKGLKAQGFSPPETANGIKKAVFKFADAVREKVKAEIQTNIQSGGCYSASLDEYTSLKNQRYMTINLHNGTTSISLGMVRVRGSLPAEKAVELFDERLAMFDLIRKQHIVGMTTDGAAVM